MTKTAENSLPIIIGELIRRMNNKERLALAHQFTWEELEEWKATEETLSDHRLAKKIRNGLADEKRGRIKPVNLKG